MQERAMLIQFSLPRWSTPVNAKIGAAALLSLISLSSSLFAHEFCESAKFVSLNDLISDRDTYLDQRVQTRAVLSTDAKEYTLLKQDEGSKLGILISSDSETEDYKKRMHLSPGGGINVVDDLFGKLRRQEGAGYKPDKTKMRYYRQDVVACGRVVESLGEIRFSVDEMRIERSYLLPWKK